MSFSWTASLDGIYGFLSSCGDLRIFRLF